MRTPTNLVQGERKILRVRWLLAAITIIAVAWLIGFIDFVGRIPGPTGSDAQGGDGERYDAIVVLTGGSGRLEAGLDLFKAGKARKLFVSGVYRGVDVAALLRLSQTDPGDVECCITLGYSADNTAGNAAETAEWMAAEGLGSMLLVTANYHLPRSLLEFRDAMSNVDIVAWPVHPDNVEVEQWWRWPGTARLLAGEYMKYLAAWGHAALRRILPAQEPV